MIALTLIAGLTAAQNLSAASPAAPPRWYRVFVSTERGRCGYTVTDVSNISAKQLREQISEGYDRHNGFAVLTNSKTSPRCSREAETLINRLGFASVVVRPAQDGDRSPGIP